MYFSISLETVELKCKDLLLILLKVLKYFISMMAPFLQGKLLIVIWHLIISKCFYCYILN